MSGALLVPFALLGWQAVVACDNHRADTDSPHIACLHLSEIPYPLATVEPPLDASASAYEALEGVWNTGPRHLRC